MLKRKQKVNDSEVLKFGFLGGMAQSVYILLISLFIQILDKSTPPPYPAQMWGPVLVLIMFVFSAGISAILMFGYPAYLAMQQSYAEALMTAVTSLLTLAMIGIFVFMLLSSIY